MRDARYIRPLLTLFVLTHLLLDMAIPLGPGAFGMGSEGSVAGVRDGSAGRHTIKPPLRDRLPRQAIVVHRPTVQPPAEPSSPVQAAVRRVGLRRRKVAAEPSPHRPTEDH